MFRLYYVLNKDGSRENIPVLSMLLKRVESIFWAKKNLLAAQKHFKERDLMTVTEIIKALTKLTNDYDLDPSKTEVCFSEGSYNSCPTYSILCLEFDDIPDNSRDDNKIVLISN